MSIYIDPVPPLRWWAADTTSPKPYGPVPEIGHETCTHRVYRLTCRQYNRLLSRAAGRCETCGLPDYQNRKGKLWIDHDNQLGNWAVRGLICLSCNNNIHRMPVRAEYEANAYFRTLLAEAGITSLKTSEPPLGSAVVDHAGRPWRHEEDGLWWPRHRRSLPQAPERWKALLYLNGPHNLRPFASVTDLEPVRS